MADMFLRDLIVTVGNIYSTREGRHVVAVCLRAILFFFRLLGGWSVGVCAVRLEGSLLRHWLCMIKK